MSLLKFDDFLKNKREQKVNEAKAAQEQAIQETAKTEEVAQEPKKTRKRKKKQ